MVHLEGERMSKGLVVVGSVALDSVEANGSVHDDVLGGSASFFSTAASYFAPVKLVAVVGEDMPEQHLKFLGARGVDLAGLERAKGKTFRWKGRYSQDLASRTTLDTQLNVFADFSPKIPAAYKSSPFVLLGNIHPSLQVDVVGQVAKPTLVCADTMNFWIDREPAALAEMLKRIDLLVINDEEARQLSGVHNLVRAAAEIRKRGPKMLVIKRGEFGALLFDDAGTFFVPAYPLEDVQDPTGAGDSFAGGLMGYVAARGEVTPSTLRKALYFASALGSFCVEGIGPARLLAATHSDLGARINAFARLVDHGGGPLSLPLPG
jgi:sugar/nucleoside kinase (ribokinase family)